MKENLDRQWNHNVAFDGRLFLSRLRKDPDNVFICLEFLGPLTMVEKHIFGYNVYIFFNQ